MELLVSAETIVAISTPPGRGGIGIVRLSGPAAVEVAGELVVLREALEHGRAVFARVVDWAGVDWAGMDWAESAGGEKQIPLRNDSQKGNGQKEDGTKGSHPNGRAVIDEAVVTAFFAPRSYTGEDLVEIAAHGSPVVLAAMVQAALGVGARLGLAVRLAGPGEFTQRAFLSGKLDLTQAEAVHDLIAAQTMDQARVAAQQMGGALARQVAPAKGSLLHLIALLEAGMDFASGELDDVEVVAPAQIAASIAEAEEPLRVLAATFRRGQLLREGAAIALVGRPNAGKSSLFNRLLERERAIVSAVPGTTRDTLEETVALGGIPLRLIDTAGLRIAAEGADAVEALGIARTHEALADADVILLIHDATQAFDEAEAALAEEVRGRPHLIIYNKIDLDVAEESAQGIEAAVRTSAVTGAGLEELREGILHLLGGVGSIAETALLNNVRQQQAVLASVTALEGAAEANRARLPHEVILMELHEALGALDALTGMTTADDILGRIFSTFCIGK